ncbi:MAG: NUDIX hydrolase N-terminal domain-containing protein [Planctomycetales bacterium]|nr:NUDIX hydrolase N-terminal domain-containing protein [Planctomycetales bacterium]
MNKKTFDWFDVAKRLKAISQAGKTFAKNEYELNRHQELEQICAEIFERHADMTAEQARGILQQDAGYPTPKVDCRGVVFKEDKILMVKEVADGGWTLPGGWCDTDMTASQNVAREVWEESGYEVKPVRLLAVFDRDNQGHTPPYPFNIYKLFFLCELTGGQAKPSHETSEVAWFAEDRLPENLSRGRTLPHELKLFFAQHRNPALPTAFD